MIASQITKLYIYIYIREPGRAEGYDIISPRASENTSWIIIGITIGIGAGFLELLGVIGGFAGDRVPINPSAAILIGVKHVAGAPASDHFPVGLHR